MPHQVSLELAASAKTSEAMLCALAAAIPDWLQLVQVGGGEGRIYRSTGGALTAAILNCCYDARLKNGQV